MSWLWGTALAEEAAEAAEQAPAWSQELVEKFSETPMMVWAFVGVLVVLALMFFAMRRSVQENRGSLVIAVIFGALLLIVLSNLTITTTPEGARTVSFAFSPTTWIQALVIGVIGVIALTVSRQNVKWTAQLVAFGALAIALSFVLSCFRLYRMPQGGSVTPGSMLPLMLFSAAFGMGPGLLAGLAYGVLQYLQGGWFANVWQFSLDYLLAFGALGLAGLAQRLPKKWGLYAAMIIAALGRALSATLAGVMFWDTAPWASLVYNGTYLIPDTAICIILALLIAKPVLKVMKAK